jgi:nicotinate-nucleotide adenylyltransferase
LTDQALIAGAGRRRIGLLGGSFNPAHDGHLHISRRALERLGLEELWWLVSPQNPLKAADAIAPLDTRMETARRLAAADRRIVVTDIEARLGTRYTADTLAALKERVPQARLVWLMGADNLTQLPKWKRWTTIMDSVPVAVFGRPTYALRALAGKAAQRYARYRLPPEAARGLADRAPPAWVFIIGPMHPASATAIRAAQRHKNERN